MKESLTILLLITLPQIVLSQIISDTSRRSLSDTGRIRVLEELCWENRINDPAKAMEYGLEALTLSEQLEYHDYIAGICNYLGIIQRNVGDNASALEYFFRAKQFAEQYNITEDLAYAHNNIGDIFNIEGRYEQALDHEFIALRYFENLGDSTGVSYCCHQIALVYANLEEYNRSVQYHVRAMKIRELNGNMAGVGYSLISIGQTYLKSGNKKEAFECLNSSYMIFNGLNDKFGLSLALHNIGIYYRQDENIEKAINYFTRAMEIGYEYDYPIRVRNAAEVLSEIYAELDMFKEAYHMYIVYKNTYDSLYHEENLLKVTQLTLKNEYEQREIMHLAEIERQKQVRNYIILSLGLLVILVIVLINIYFIKRKAAINLQNKNKEIESQKEILEKLSVSLRNKNEELSQQNEEILSQKDHLQSLNDHLEKQRIELNNTLEELTKTQIKLVQSETMASLGQLTAGVAHELNNPLNFISTSIAPLKRNMEDLLSLLVKFESLIDEKDMKGKYREVTDMKKEMDYDFMIDETRKLLAGIFEGAHRSENIVKDLRTFSRMDENEFKAVDIHRGIDSTLLLLSNKTEDRITIHKNYGKLQHIICLPGKLNQVFMNILVNSIKAIEDKGDIYITTASDGDQARISIRDTGKGISPEIVEHIFEPFFTTRAVGEGTGLGLSISYSIIQEHKGTIEVFSKPGEGTEFIIKLPFVR